MKLAPCLVALIAAAPWVAGCRAREAAAPSTAASEPQSLWVRVADDYRGPRLSWPYRVQRAPDLGARSARGDFTLRLLDANGAQLATYSFGARWHPTNEQTDTPPPSGGSLFVPPIEFARAVLEVEGREVAQRTRSAHTPELSIQEPAPAELAREDGVELRWTARDEDGDQLLYLVEHSSDAGRTFQLHTIDLAENHIELDARSIVGSDHTIFRVTASDGLRSTSAQTRPLRVPNRAPSVRISQPGSYLELAGEGQLLLSASATDPEDGMLTREAISWSSSLQGDLGRGPQVRRVHELAQGKHIITATATDARGATARDVVIVDIAHQLDRSSMPPSRELTVRTAARVVSRVAERTELSFVVQNVGRDAARGGFAVGALLPPDLRYLGVRGNEWRCDARHDGHGERVTCLLDIPGLAAGRASPEAALVLRPRAVGLFAVRLDLWGDDDVLMNNTPSVQVHIAR